MESPRHRRPEVTAPDADRVRQAARQIERADLYLAAVESLSLGARGEQRELSRLRVELDRYRRRLLRSLVV